MKNGTSKIEIPILRSILWSAFLIFGHSLLSAVLSPPTSASAAEFREIPLSAERREALDSHIERFASSSTKIREQAKREVLEFGSAAIESLRKAQNHPDLAVSESAAYCLRLLTRDLLRSDDPPEVQRNLVSYSTNEWYYQSLALSRLSSLAPDVSLRPLLRILLHEENSLSGRSAALAIYWTLPHAQPFRQWPTVLPDEKPYPTEEFQTARNQQAVAERVSLQNEIRRYLVSESAQTPGKTFFLQLLDLENALKQDGDSVNTQENAPSASVVSEIEELLAPILQDALKEGQPEKMTFLQETLYACADLLAQSGRRDEAEAFFLSWRQKNVCALDSNRFQFTERRLQTLHIRFLLTQRLLARGRWDWGKSEMRHLLDQMQQTERIRYSRHFCNSLKALGDFATATEEMKKLRRFQFLSFANAPETPLGQNVEKDEKNEKNEMARSAEETSEYTAQILYFQGLDACAKKDYPRAKKFLSKNMTLQENIHIDGLILARRLALFTEDADWLREVDARIDQQLEKTQKSIQILKKNPLIPREELLSELNLFAWLAANTERRLDEARKYAQEAVEASPESESIRDTLATTCVAAGELEKALKIQTEAVAMNPHELELLQNLEKIRFLCAEKKATR